MVELLLEERQEQYVPNDTHLEVGWWMGVRVWKLRGLFLLEVVTRGSCPQTSRTRTPPSRAASQLQLMLCSASAAGQRPALHDYHWS